jgi:hypothetical protein
VLFACGQADDSERDGRTQAAICAGAPKDNGDGTVTTIACAFEQQASNMHQYGARVAGTTLFDARGTRLATVDTSCDVWWMGTDSDGVAVIISQGTGEVRSHGTFHAGMATSALAAQVPTPLRTE